MSDYPTSKRKRKPLGKLPPLTDAQLEEMSKVTPQDIEAAAALWRANVPPKYAKLLDAEPSENAEQA